MPLYPYPEGNEVLIRTLNLQPHPEAGFYCETARTKETVPSPFADNATRSMATQIYYLLTPDSPQGKMHMNKSITYHLLHQGRAKYTLIRPASSPSSSPKIKHVVMGADSSRGEVRQLVVEGGWWKASEIPEEDLQEGEKDTTGCLISEASTLQTTNSSTSGGLVELFGGDESHPAIEGLLPYTQER
ncbi:hypothetical protein JCM10908_001027 [Rhodotorula pacifica]|uniref:Cff1p n=1 Tax=Rhodotorula pacifica TaxID=1495444 RepID=UPI00317CB0E5